MYVVDDKNVAHVRDVDLGDPMGNRILVTNGLLVGEKVIVQGATLVADGVEVQIIP